MRILVGVAFAGQQRALLSQKGDDGLIGLEDVFSHQFGQAHFCGVVAAAIHGGEDLHAVFTAGLIVVCTVPGGDVHLTRPGVGGHKEAVDDLGGAR